tara:strand:- start:869 stop:3115 length:2247 start_codon:yes stop_codon:yes gene_type:complete
MRKFIKLFSALALFFLIFTANSFSEIVNKVKIQGNERISLESIMVFGDITLGNNYESQDINLLIKKLYETNFFSDIETQLKDGVLTVTVRENPIVNSIVFDGEEANKYIDALNEMLNLREKTSFVKNYIKSDINIIKEFYRHLGFYFAKIDLTVEKLSNNRVNLIYKLEKGEKAKISKIYFLGEKKIRDNRLRNIITSEESRFWKVFSRNVYLNKSRIDLDKRLLKNYYKNKGYYEVDISSSSVEYSEGEGFVLSYTINAGKRYKFEKIYLDIDDALDKTAFLGLEEIFNEIVGEYYSQRKLTAVLEEIDELSQQKELQFINHGVTETLDDDGVEIKVRIFEGKKFMIERINIVGNNVTNDSVIRSEMLVDEGDPYSVLLINKSINKLRARGIFGNVKHKISEGSSPDLKVLEVSIEEKATGEISAGAGVGTEGTSFMFSVQENNWLGRGIRLNSALNVSEQEVSGNISINNPNYKFSGNSVFGALDISSSDYANTSGYESSKTGISFGTSFEQYEDIYLSPSLSASYEDIEVGSDASTAIQRMDGSFTNADFFYGITVDKRDQAFQTTSGYVTKFVQSIPIVLDSSSLLNGFDVQTYHDLSEDLIGTVKFYARSIHGMNDEDVRLTSRLHIPSKRIRGFQSRRIGPKDGEDFVGGNYATALSFEGKLPNLLPEDTKTDISVFLDTANLWAVDYSDTINDSSTLRSSIGVSANVFTTIGPLTFTLAQDLSKANTDKTETFNFRIGTSF